MRRTVSSLASLSRAVSTTAAPSSRLSGSRLAPALVSQWQWKRMYSSAQAGAPLDASKLTIEKTTKPSALKDPKDLVFGRTFTDHMLVVEWTKEAGWGTPKIQPYQNLSLDPATCVFHYAFECFEGMKAYKDAEGTVRLFRPDKNMERFNKSTARIALPTFDPQTGIELISKFVEVESRFIPEQKGYSLYLRPTMIGTQKTLGVGAPGSAMMFVIASPVGPYYPTGFKAVSLEATDYAVRAWPGGVGDKKLGANYAPCIVPQIQAASRGFQQNLWLFGDEEYVTEVGTMNFFAAIKNKQTGVNELLTAPLDGTILEGVTRDSVLTLARERLVPEGWKVVERKFSIKELYEADKEGRLLEAFGSGTAAIVSPVRNISWKGQMIQCGLKAEEESGPIARRMKDWIEGIQTGEENHKWSYVAK
ncbi:Branched-chain-amino-acid aminotransferase, cytosolic [Ceratocystis lukuohia]|uniref:Branched-chain-amino-acid aminotransferase n=1 Tax=Ceratocystis lukuohia TaxID=2019550 RepID=A0ABR4MJH7_9PEZI